MAIHPPRDYGRAVGGGTAWGPHPLVYFCVPDRFTGPDPDGSRTGTGRVTGRGTARSLRVTARADRSHDADPDGSPPADRAGSQYAARTGS
ncbi:hypothetical protein D9753_16040 [Streptomyces dangxiongensis]|uniref:Uncharacterized protein n=1 Tax=Streptomyces dangxiongensis TaxID=1442032 RepID=A0A3G2JCY2_9ACTN|nr:hypothetical protein D9753_16040 [Streptomyces dangxiongensis]